MRNNKLIKALIIVASILFAVAIIKNLDTPKESNVVKQLQKSNADRSLKYYAFEKAQYTIKSQLKAPSTAIFPDVYANGLSDHVIQIDSLYRVSSFVDSQNSFGAMLRAEYVVEMIYVGGEWSLVSVVFDGERLF